MIGRNFAIYWLFRTQNGGMVSESSALAKNAGNMKQTYDEEVDADLLEEYDFLAASEVKFAEGWKLVLLDPDLGKAFADSAYVNEAFAP